MPELSVELTANIKRLERELKTARKQLSGLENQAEDAQRAVSGIGTRPVQQVRRFQAATANATPTLQEFSRIIQDAPFGIQGVGNNIEQLTNNFGNLSRAAGGTIPALKLVAGAFVGPAGVLFAVSTAVSLLTVFGDKLFSSKNKIDELKKSIEKLNETFDAELDLNKQLGENLKIQGLSTTDILKSRREILQRQLGSVGAALAENSALLQQLKIQNEIVSDWELILGIGKKLAGFVAIGLVGAYQQSKKALDAIRKPLEELLLGEIDRSKFSAATAKQKEKQTELETENLRIQTQIQQIVGSILAINKQITNEKEKQLKGPRVDPITGGLGDLFKVTEGIGPALVDPILLAAKQVRPALSNIETAINDFNARADTIIKTNIADTFAGIGEAIGSSILDGGNVFEALAQSLLSSLGGILIQLGEMAIGIGVGLLAIKKALTTLNPLAAIGAGVALIALGSVFKSGAAKIGGGIGAGGASSGGFTSGRQSFGGATSTFSSGGFSSGEVVFRIQGNDLVGVMNRSLGKNARLGGSLSVG